MEKKRVFKSIFFIVVLIIITIGVYFGYYYFTGKENPFLEFLSGNDEKVTTIDNQNGFYVYTELLDKAYSAYSGCTLNSIDMEYVVIGDAYKLYRTSCLGTFFIENGKTEDLDIKYDDSSKLFYLEKDGKTYYKKHEVTSLIPGNMFLRSSGNMINALSYKFVLRETESKGNYYNLVRSNIDGATGFNLYVYYMNSEEYGEDVLYTMSVESDYTDSHIFTRPRYDYSMPSTIEQLPDVYPYGKMVVIVERDRVGQRYANNFIVLGKKDFIYDLYNQFPITVNDHEITQNDNIYVAYQPYDRTFKLLISSTDKFCEDDSDSEEIAYYLFSLQYNYTKSNFDPPKFEKVGYKNEGCKYVDSLLGG